MARLLLLWINNAVFQFWEASILLTLEVRMNQLQSAKEHLLQQA
jgi:hypothetical protein